MTVSRLYTIQGEARNLLSGHGTDRIISHLSSIVNIIQINKTMRWHEHCCIDMDLPPQNMKKLITALFLAGAMAASTAWGSTITLTDSHDHGSPALGGGIFIATTSDNGTFPTFCLELNEHISYGAPYQYLLSDRAVFGGVNTPTPGYDIISKGTALLYADFRKGILPGGPVNAGQLQLAIWALENELSSTQWTTYSVASNPYLVYAESVYGSFAGAWADYTGGVVRVVQIWDVAPAGDAPGRGAHQDVLWAPPVPEGGITIALLGAALLALAAFRRRFI